MFVVAGENLQPPAFSDSPEVLAVQHEECSAPFDLTYNCLHKFFLLIIYIFWLVHLNLT